MQFLTEQGLELKTERGQRVFPVSDKSSDVIRTLERVLKDRHVQVHLKQQVCDLWIEDNEIRGIFLSGGEKVEADVVILAAGGVSYPSTGSTGDGYRMAEHAGHHVTPRVPSLVPMVVDDAWCTELQGLSLKNINFFPSMREERILPGIRRDDVYTFWHYRTGCIKRQYPDSPLSEERHCYG